MDIYTRQGFESQSGNVNKSLDGQWTKSRVRTSQTSPHSSPRPRTCYQPWTFAITHYTAVCLRLISFIVVHSQQVKCFLVKKVHGKMATIGIFLNHKYLFVRLFTVSAQFEQRNFTEYFSTTHVSRSRSALFCRSCVSSS